MLRRIPPGFLHLFILIAIWGVTPVAQPQVEVARAIDPGGVQLPPESATVADTKFSFIAYGDTRGPADGLRIQPAHQDVINRMLAVIPEQASAGFPVRFVVQSGDAVVGGRYAEQWNVSFTPLIERLMQEGHVPYLFAVGNHDVGTLPVHTPERDAGLRNANAAMAHLWPPDGSPDRMTGYPTFTFAYGRFFFVVLDSNVASDRPQFEWVKKRLESLDRTRYTQVIAVFHHPPLTTGPHGGPLVEPQAQAIRRMYMPLFRAHHVRMTITGHDHLFDHFIEHYEDRSGVHRIDHIVSGGGGAPIYNYRGEQDFKLYEESASPQRVRLLHPTKPGLRDADNPHHFVIFEVDGDRIWIKVEATVAAPFLPQPNKIELADN